MMYVRKPSWMTDDGDEGLHVFVPGLMVTGILVSMVMLLSDGIRKLFPSRGRRARAVHMELKARGRISDLDAVLTGTRPAAPRIDREPHAGVVALAFAGLALAVTAFLAWMTMSAYSTPGSTLYQRGWTLSFGLGMSAIPGTLGLIWLLSAAPTRIQPRWVKAATRHWPVGRLPDIDEPGS